MSQAIGVWTLAELDRLPDDGNKYELVDGELFVTPAPSVSHEELATVLQSLLDPYVAAQQLGRVYRPRAVLRALGSEVEPDLMVRRIDSVTTSSWDNLPMPSLVVEILSDTTRRRDLTQKRRFYMRCGVGEYWIVDGARRSIRVVSANVEDREVVQALSWHPQGAEEPLILDVSRFFALALNIDR